MRLISRPGPALVTVAVALLLVGATGPATRAQGDLEDQRMTVPGGTTALLGTAGVTAPVEPPRALLVIARALHGGLPSDGPPVGIAKVEPYLAAATVVEGPTPDEVPSLLPRAVWEQAVFGRAVEPAALAFTILRDRRASLLYCGLFSLDPGTLAYLAAHPPLLTSIYRASAGPFAAFAEAITIRADRVVLPGGEAHARQWEDLVGAPAGEPDRFIPALLGRDAGRLAWLFATVASLDPARLRFALGSGLEPLYEAFAVERLPIDFSAHPFSRPAVDLGFVLRTIGVTERGTLLPPSDLLLWEKVFTGDAHAPAGVETTAGWLLQALAPLPSRERRARLETLLFAQRVFAAAADTRAAGAPDVLWLVLSAYRSHSALMLTFERLGFTEPRDFLEAARTAGELAAGVDRYRASLRLAMFQGALALVMRMRDVDTIDAGTGRGFAMTLVRLPAGDPAGYADRVAAWLEGALLPAIPNPPGSEGRSAEEKLIDGLSGARPGRSLPIITWEDQAYRVDLAAGERARLQRIRERQGRNDLTTLLELRRLRNVSNAEAAAVAARLLSSLGLPDGRGLFLAGESAAGPGVPPAAAGAGTQGTDRAKTAGRGDRAGWQEALLAELLASYTYAIAIGDPDSSLLLAGNPAHMHDFDVGASASSGAWVLAASVRAGSQMIMRGSLLGLERALAQPSLRQTTLDAPRVAPNIDQQDLQGIAESVVTLNPFRLDDHGRDVLVSAIRRGRERVLAAARDPRDLDSLAEQAGVERWRRRLMRLAAAAGDAAVMRYWSLGELRSLGQVDTASVDGDGWGVSQRLIDGSWRAALPARADLHDLEGRIGTGLLSGRIPDLHLRAAEWLAGLNLPASLAPGILRAAAWDLAMSTQMADLDDWLAIVRAVQALPADRVEDYVSALTADGPLVPVSKVTP